MNNKKSTMSDKEDILLRTMEYMTGGHDYMVPFTDIITVGTYLERNHYHMLSIDGLDTTIYLLRKRLNGEYRSREYLYRMWYVLTAQFHKTITLKEIREIGEYINKNKNIESYLSKNNSLTFENVVFHIDRELELDLFPHLFLVNICPVTSIIW